MTRRETLSCVHEPFGDAFYYGPERLSLRYEEDEKARMESGFGDSTFQTIFDRFDREGSEVRLFPPAATIMSLFALAKQHFIPLHPSSFRSPTYVGTDNPLNILGQFPLTFSRAKQWLASLFNIDF